MENQFCNIVNNSHVGICTQCINCLDHKKKQGSQLCAETASDCGACISGYYEEILTDRKRTSCTPKTYAFETTASPLVSGNDVRTTLIVVCSLGLAVVLIICGFLCFNRTKYMRHHTAVEDVGALALPPYPAHGGMCDVELQAMSSYSCDVQEHSFYYDEKKGEVLLQQAVPFTGPQDVYERFYDDDVNDDDNGSQDEEENFYFGDGANLPFSPPTLDDEDTLPSTWTPGPMPQWAERNLNNTVADTTAVGEDADDSGISMPSTNFPSTSSLTVPVEHTLILFSVFATLVGITGVHGTNDEPGSSLECGVPSNKRQRSPDSQVSVKRVRRNSGSVGDDSDDEAECD